MRIAKRSIDRSHVIALGLIIAAILLFLLFARPRILGQGKRPLTGTPIDARANECLAPSQ